MKGRKPPNHVYIWAPQPDEFGKEDTVEMASRIDDGVRILHRGALLKKSIDCKNNRHRHRCSSSHCNCKCHDKVI